jgi:hypothetical protein
LWTAIVLLADRRALVARNRIDLGFRGTNTVPVLAVIVVALFAFTTADDWAVVNVRSSIMSWHATLAAARHTCRLPPDRRPPQSTVNLGGWDNGSEHVQKPRFNDITIVVAPYPADGQTPDFGIVIPCRTLLLDTS